MREIDGEGSPAAMVSRQKRQGVPEAGKPVGKNI
jgi:hypothetical protein